MWIHVAFGVLFLTILQWPIAWLVRADARDHGVGNPDTWYWGIILPIWGLMLIPYYWSKRAEILGDD